MIFEKQVVTIYKSGVHNRCDVTGNVFYFSYKDFPGLNRTSYTFTSSLGHTLCGYFYYYNQMQKSRIVIFEHGLGGGHTAYMQEINKLCSKGYTVFTYDHTGCMESGGKSTNGLAQSLRDLDDCINALRSSELYSSSELMVVGHSWGGFSAMNICALHKDVSKVVAISGFISIEALIIQNISGILENYRPAILELERTCNPEFSRYNAVSSLKNSETPTLLIYSDNDKSVKKELHYDALLEGLSSNTNITFMLEKNKGHNPNYTEDAVSYKDAFFTQLNKNLKKPSFKKPEAKKKFVESYDWIRMTTQDEKVWDKIFAHLG